jgi:peptide/nickel transport system substrate-binding protein
MNYYWIGFRQYASPYTNVKFRQMVNSAIDMDGIIANVLLNGTGSRAYGVVPPGLWPRDLDFMKANAIQQDKELAKQLFAELIAEGVMTSETEVVFHVNQDAVRELIGEIIVSELQSIGVNAVLKISEWAAYLDAVIKTEEPCMYMLGTTPKIPDPDAVFSWLFSSGEDGSTHGSLILGLSEQPEINQLLLEARTTPDQSQREELYKEIQRWAITENAYHIPAFHLSVTMAHSTKVHGLVALPSQIWMLCTETANVWVDGN